MWQPFDIISIVKQSGSTGLESDDEKGGEFRDMTHRYINHTNSTLCDEDENKEVQWIRNESILWETYMKDTQSGYHSVPPQ